MEVEWADQTIISTGFFSFVRSFQFYSPIRDYSNIDSPAPKYKEDK